MDLSQVDFKEHKHEKRNALKVPTDEMLRGAQALTMAQLTTSPFAPQGAQQQSQSPMQQPSHSQPIANKRMYTEEEVRRIVHEAIKLEGARVREEFQGILNEQLREQFNMFSRFNQDYVARSMQRSVNDYYS